MPLLNEPWVLHGRQYQVSLRRVDIDLVQLAQKDPDYKSRIIEWAQKSKVEITFESKEELISSQKSPSFVSDVLLNREPKGTGRGDSKKEAEQQAAKAALKSLHTL